jgi:hypothetical protein
MTSNYNLTLPSIPAVQSFMALDTSGNMSGYASVTGGITASNIANGTITSTQVASQGIAQSNLYIRTTGTSPGAGNVAINSPVTTQITSTSPQNIGSQLTLVTTGRPVVLMIAGTTGGNTTFLVDQGQNGGNLQIVRDGSAAFVTNVGGNTTTGTYPITHFVDTPAAGSHTYQLQGNTNVGSFLNVGGICLVAYEL